jgi:hypothetical protein
MYHKQAFNYPITDLLQDHSRVEMAAVPEEEAEPGEASNTKYAAESKGESRIKSTKN